MERESDRSKSGNFNARNCPVKGCRSVLIFSTAVNVYNDRTLAGELRRAAVSTGLVTWRTPSRGPSPAPWMGTSLLIFCLFFSQAFLNYFYLCQYLLLMGMTDWFARDTEAA